MGRLTDNGSGQDRPLSVVVEPVPTKNPGVYVARTVSDIFVKTGDEFSRLSEGPKRVHKKGRENLRKRGETREYLEKKKVSGR
jgi:hypothetical protein